MNMKDTLKQGLRGMLIVALGLTFLSGCSGEPPALTIGDVAFTESELVGFNDARRTRLAELTAFGLSVSRNEAPALGRPLVQRRLDESLLEVLEDEMTVRLAGFDEGALQARYSETPEYELTVRHLVLLVEEWASEEEEALAREKAQAALDRIESGEDFAAVAGEVSEEPGALARGGLLEPGRKGTWVEDFWVAASALEVGEVSPVIRTEYGFHVLKLEDRSPIPFGEARRAFVERLAGLISIPGDALKRWTDSVSAGLVVDSAALSADFQAAGGLFVLADHLLAEEHPDASVARWPGGSYTAGELSGHLLSQDRPSWEHMRAGGVEELLRVATDASRRALLVDLAGSMGISLAPEVEEGLRREWEAAVQAWAQNLGFATGMGTAAVKANALTVVAATGQAVSLAREDVENWAPMVLSFYPVGPRGE